MRAFSGVNCERQNGKQKDGSWQFLLPGGVERVFRIVPHGRLVLENGKQLQTIGFVKSDVEAEEKISQYLRGLI